MADYTAVGTPDKKKKWQWCRFAVSELGTD
jgi:hypothetical protein